MYMRDEKQFLEEMERQFNDAQPHLAHQIKLYHEEWGQFNHGHIKHFAKLTACPGFTGSLALGDALDTALAGLSASHQVPDRVESSNEEEDDDADDENILSMGINLVDIALDE